MAVMAISSAFPPQNFLTLRFAKNGKFKKILFWKILNYYHNYSNRLKNSP